MKLRSGTEYTFNSQSIKNSKIKSFKISTKTNSISCVQILFSIMYLYIWYSILYLHNKNIYYFLEKHINYTTNYSYQLFKNIDINSFIDNYTDFDEFEYDFYNNSLTFI